MSLTEAPAADPCPVCGGGVSRLVYSQARDPITLSAFRVVECAACGIVFTTPRPTSLDAFYPQRYRAYGPLVTRLLQMFYGLRISRWARLKPQGGSVLEVGSGPGLMLAAFRSRGWNVLGIERNEAVAESARRALGLEIVTTPVAELPADVRFDLIILFQVLEHIAEPVPLLRECARRLAPGGRVVMNVPNFSSWQSRFAGPKWFHLDVPRHLVHFTPATLRDTLARAGLELVEMRFSSPEHDPYGWVESTINRLTGRTNTLTRFLMGFDPFGPAVLLSFVMGAVLALPATLLAGASWLAGSGALMEASARRSTPSEQ
ncbi:MAG TPA: class I SAM-dependent methyltransferase [Candidatus Acidoferrales bacterium]|nr:class I SAM-dependent methyltransferase [Candidatus Acidoferrales bacterium]